MDILEKAEKTIQDYSLIRKNDRILAAVSGGSDSVALLDVLCRLRKKYGLILFAAHVNHHLRENAARDAEFVESLCRERDVNCFICNANVAGYASEKGISEELAGREIRYAYFHQLKAEYKLDSIATAHNQNDAAESTLIHFIRGSGLGGLCGIPYARKDGVIRPLLDVQKAEIEAYCVQRGLAFVVDETNFQTKYMRNKIRLEVLPEILRINPNFISNITKNAQILVEDEKFLNAAAQAAYNNAVWNSRLDIQKLKTMDIAMQRRVVQLLYQSYRKSPENLQFVHVDAVLSLVEHEKTGSRIQLPQNTDAVLEYGMLFFMKRTGDTTYHIPIPIGQETEIPYTGLRITVSPCKAAGEDSMTKIYCSIPRDGKLYVRPRRQGDFFYPTGMEGRKKLSDYFTDLKIPRHVRDKIPLLFCGEELVWVVGYRRDKRFLVKNDKKINYAVEIFGEI